MKFFYKLIFVFCVFLLALGMNIQSADTSYSINLKEGNIYSVEITENKAIGNIENETSISRNIIENIQNLSRIKTTSFGSDFSKSEIAQNKLFQIISYIYLKSYLDNIKSKNLSRITYSINPNAP